MRATISTVAFLLVVGCGGRTLLDDPNDELPLPDASAVHVTPKEDAGEKADGGSSSPGTTSCGTKACTATEDCCGTMSGMSVSVSCVKKGSCTMGAVVACMSKTDCEGGDLCCASLGGGGGGATTTAGGFSIAVSCEKTCGMGGFQLCASDSECSKGVTCQDTGFGAKLCGGLGGLLGGAGGAGGLGGFGGFDAGFGGLGGLGGLGGFGGH